MFDGQDEAATAEAEARAKEFNKTITKILEGNGSADVYDRLALLATPTLAREGLQIIRNKGVEPSILLDLNRKLMQLARSSAPVAAETKKEPVPQADRPTAGEAHAAEIEAATPTTQEPGGVQSQPINQQAPNSDSDASGMVEARPSADPVAQAPVADVIQSSDVQPATINAPIPDSSEQEQILRRLFNTLKKISPEDRKGRKKLELHIAEVVKADDAIRPRLEELLKQMVATDKGVAPFLYTLLLEPPTPQDAMVPFAEQERDLNWAKSLLGTGIQQLTVSDVEKDPSLLLEPPTPQDAMVPFAEQAKDLNWAKDLLGRRIRQLTMSDVEKDPSLSEQRRRVFGHRRESAKEQIVQLIEIHPVLAAYAMHALTTGKLSADDQERMQFVENTGTLASEINVHFVVFLSNVYNNLLSSDPQVKESAEADIKQAVDFHPALLDEIDREMKEYNIRGHDINQWVTEMIEQRAGQTPQAARLKIAPTNASWAETTRVSLDDGVLGGFHGRR